MNFELYNEDNSYAYSNINEYIYGFQIMIRSIFK